MSKPTKRREEYEQYLASPTWKRLRKAALARDKSRCRGCGEKAVNVHHERYPKVLGEEKMEWLFSVCAPCHTEIHALVAKGSTLPKATRAVIVPLPGNVTVLPDDWRLSKKQSKKRGRWEKGKARQPKKQSKAFRQQQKKATPVKLALIAENEALRKTLADNRERRERRKMMGG